MNLVRFNGFCEGCEKVSAPSGSGTVGVAASNFVKKKWGKAFSRGGEFLDQKVTVFMTVQQTCMFSWYHSIAFFFKLGPRNVPSSTTADQDSLCYMSHIKVILREMKFFYFHFFHHKIMK